MSSGECQASAGSYDEGVTLKLRERGHDRQHGFPHGATGADALGGRAERLSFALDGLDELEDIARVSTEPVEMPWDHASMFTSPSHPDGDMETAFQTAALVNRRCLPGLNSRPSIWAQLDSIATRSPF